MVFAVWFLPTYLKGELTTAYEFLEERFGGSMRKTASTTFIITRLLADGVRLFATACPLTIIFLFAGAFERWGDMELYLLASIIMFLLYLFYSLMAVLIVLM